MADILILCPSCRHEQTLSEYVNPESVTCAHCETPLEVPTNKKVSGLTMKDPDAFRTVDSDEEPTSTLPDELTQTNDPPESMATNMDDVYQSRGKEIKGPMAFWGWLGFLVVMAGLVFCQLAVQGDNSLISTYNWIRGIIAGLVFLLVVVVAFEDHVWQGVLTLCILPYTLYYALFRLDSYILRSLFLAVLAAFCAEIYFIPEEAVFMHTQSGLNEFIRGIDSMIQRAGDAPVYNN